MGIYKDVNNNGQVDIGVDYKCFKHCGINWLSTNMEDNELCMQGLKLERSYIVNGRCLFFCYHISRRSRCGSNAVRNLRRRFQRMPLLKVRFAQITFALKHARTIL